MQLQQGLTDPTKLPLAGGIMSGLKSTSTEFLEV
jgi:hypothetical protein